MRTMTVRDLLGSATADDAFVVIDADRRLVDADAAACRLLRRSYAHLVGRRVDDFLAPGGRRQLMREWRNRVVDGSSARSLVLPLRDGRIRAVALVAVADCPMPGMQLARLRRTSVSRRQRQPH